MHQMQSVVPVPFDPGSKKVSGSCCATALPYPVVLGAAAGCAATGAAAAGSAAAGCCCSSKSFFGCSGRFSSGFFSNLLASIARTVTDLCKRHERAIGKPLASTAVTCASSTHSHWLSPCLPVSRLPELAGDLQFVATREQ